MDLFCVHLMNLFPIECKLCGVKEPVSFSFWYVMFLVVFKSLNTGSLIHNRQSIKSLKYIYEMSSQKGIVSKSVRLIKERT